MPTLHVVWPVLVPDLISFIHPLLWLKNLDQIDICFVQRDIKAGRARYDEYQVNICENWLQAYFSFSPNICTFYRDGKCREYYN